MEAETSNGGGIGGLYVKVMTDDQMELLRQQISVYATICEQLVEMHKAVTTQQDLAGFHCFLTQQHYSTYYYCFTPQGYYYNKHNSFYDWTEQINNIYFSILKIALHDSWDYLVCYNFEKRGHHVIIIPINFRVMHNWVSFFFLNLWEKVI